MSRLPRWNHQTRLLAAFLLVATPALAGAIGAALFVLGNTWQAWLGVSCISALTLALALAMRKRTLYPLHTLGNLLEALREGDYSLRGSRARRGDAVGEVVTEVNALADTLRAQRLALEEKSAQLTKVLGALDIAILSFDDAGFLTLANPAAQHLLARSFAELDGRSAATLGVAAFLDGDTAQVLDHAFPARSGRWEIRHARYRANGRPHDLLVISDLSRALREEERLAWQRLVRVLGHELNNSLAPIRSMAETVAEIVAREPLPSDWREDARSGLSVIAERADALARFMARYTQLARLPPPSRREVAFDELARRVARLEQRLSVKVMGGPPCRAQLDPDQIEQALINLVRNAADAALPAGGVQLGWYAHTNLIEVEISDDGPGLPTSGNLFVPFFTTKPRGSGIGLVLARQIIEQHGGTLALTNRTDARGCKALVRLPLLR